MEAVFACAGRTSFADPGLLEPCVKNGVRDGGLMDYGIQGGPLGLYLRTNYPRPLYAVSPYLKTKDL